MKGIRKEFSVELYTKFDAAAKRAAAFHLQGKQHSVAVPAENYGPDIVSWYCGHSMYHEVEVFAKWTSGLFPYDTGSVPGRKLRLVEMLPLHTKLYLWRLRSDLRRALVFNSKYLTEQYIEEVPNCKIQTGEYFYRIPTQLGKEFDLICP